MAAMMDTARQALVSDADQVGDGIGLPEGHGRTQLTGDGDANTMYSPQTLYAFCQLGTAMTFW
jgi:hypothetical protein